MAFYFECEHCKRRMKVPNSVAGKQIRCFDCRKQTQVPALVSRSDQSVIEQSVGGSIPRLSRGFFQWLEPKVEYLAPPFQPSPLMYLAFVVLLLPLLILSRPQNDFQRDFREISKSAQEFSSDPNRPVDFDTTLSPYPGKKIPGSLLSRDSKVHWFYGAVSWSFTLIFILLVFPKGSASLLQLSAVALFTALVGVGWLLLLQYLAFASINTSGMTGAAANLIPVLKGFAIVYLLAFIPSANFWGNLLGFIGTVGMFEELFKALPFMSQRQSMKKTSYQTVCVWGLASGMGFGVAEAIFYSAKLCNGIAPGGVYVVRFVSCVAIQAIFTAIAALLFYKVYQRVSSRSWAVWIFVTVFSVVPSAILHGLFDSLLRRQMAPAALLVGLASFLLLAFLIETASGEAQQRELEDSENEGQTEIPAALAGVLSENAALVSGVTSSTATGESSEEE